MAKKVILNAKMRRTSICGAMETLLINEKIISTYGVQIVNHLLNHGCEVRADNKINKFFNFKLKKATRIDWQTEYLDSIVSVKSVKNVQEAVQHILDYGTMHTDCIISTNKKQY